MDLDKSDDMIGRHGMWQMLIKNVSSVRKIVESSGEFLCR